MCGAARTSPPFTQNNRIDKLRYIQRNPVRAGLLKRTLRRMKPDGRAA